MMRHGWGRGARNVSPQQACIDRLARRAGFVASIGFKLNLTADQKPLWDKLMAATQSAEDNQRKLCAALPASADDRGKQTVIDRMNHRQQVLPRHRLIAQCRSYEVALGMVQAGLGVCLVPALTAFDGTKLVEGVIAQTRYTDFELEVTDVNMPARECYRKIGFVDMRRKKEKFGRIKGFRERIYMHYTR